MAKTRELDLTVDRRAFLYGTAAGVAQAGVAAALPNPAQWSTEENSPSGARQQKPNLVIYHSDPQPIHASSGQRQGEVQATARFGLTRI